MIHTFSSEHIAAIGKILGVVPKNPGDGLYRMELENREEKRKLALEIQLDVKVDGSRMHMISVYAANTFLQLHNCTAFAASEILHQVTFFGKDGKRISGLIIEKEAGCSLYANVSEAIIKGDFTRLPEDLMMCGIALSLTESPDFGDFTYED
ncbi:MAG: hypothetical protein WDZ29_04410 [Balneolaceae bacterium]